MPPESLEFKCPNCQVGLLVPKNSAGVSGPCPHCEAVITSPSPIPGPQSKTPPTKSKLRPLPPISDSPNSPSSPKPQARKTPIPRKQAIPAKGGTPSLKTRKPLEKKKKGSGCWLALFFILFLSTAAYFVLSFLNLVPDWRSIESKLFPKALKIEQSSTPIDRKSGPDQTIPPGPAPIKITPPAPAPEKPSPDPEPIPEPQASPSTPPPPENTPAPTTSRESLTQFLSATSLEQRRALMTTSEHPESALRDSVLSGPFPESNHPKIESKFAHLDSETTESYYSVSFKSPLVGELAEVVVKIDSEESGEPPKVDIAHFLDLLSPPVLEFSEKISPESLSFHAIIEASAYCFDDIPDSDKMAKLIFYRSMNSQDRALATAYLPRNSEIFQRLRKHEVQGSRIPGIVTVKWNQVTDPSKPYLEVSAITSPELH